MRRESFSPGTTVLWGEVNGESVHRRSAVKHRQAGSKLTDRTAMRCAAGERALFTSNAECGTARQVRREMENGLRIKDYGLWMMIRGISHGRSAWVGFSCFLSSVIRCFGMILCMDSRGGGKWGIGGIGGDWELGNWRDGVDVRGGIGWGCHSVRVLEY